MLLCLTSALDLNLSAEQRISNVIKNAFFAMQTSLWGMKRKITITLVRLLGGGVLVKQTPAAMIVTLADGS